MTLGMAFREELPEELRIELDGLRSSLLDSLLLLTLFVPVAWLVYIMSQSYASGWVDVAVLQFVVCVFVALVVRGRNVGAASWILLSSVCACYALVVLSHPDSAHPALAAPVVILAQALLGGWRSFFVTAVLWGLGVGGQTLAGSAPTSAGSLRSLGVLYATWGAMWLTSRQLRSAIGWALGGWERAEQLLTETRDRRGEVYRALRALEEATYRIERMNGELSVARSEAERARAFKDHYATTVSHELRGPLSLILGFSRLMALSPERYDAPLPAAYYADVDAIYRNAQHLSMLLDDILDLAQIEAERLPLIKGWLDVQQDVCATAVEIVRPLASRKGLQLELSLTGNLPRIVADGVRLRQVLLNLLTNAIRHTEHGSVTVSCTRQSEEMLIRVSDTGSGIAPEDMPRLFEEFYQAAPHGSRQGSSGLGLSISKQLVELHGGRMWAESAPGVGTSFTLTLPLPGSLPLLQSDTAQSSKTSSEVHLTPHQARVCLVLHTPARVVRVLSRYLEGYRVIAMDDDEEALSVIEDLHPTAILAPTGKAERVASLVRDTSHDVPIITCDIPESAVGAHLEGVLAHLVKPVSADMLASLMKKIERDGETCILLADDEPDSVRLLESMLMTLPRPYRIHQAYDGAQALARMQQIMPDVVFLDLVMPGMTGAEVTQAMRDDPRLCDVPVIIVSAQDPADQSLILQTPLTVVSSRPVELGRAAKGLVALLDMLSSGATEPAPSQPR